VRDKERKGKEVRGGNSRGGEWDGDRKVEKCMGGVKEGRGGRTKGR